MDTYKDEFYSNFNDIMSFLNFINKIELNSTWFTGKCKNISFEALTDENEIVENLKNEYVTKGVSKIIEDTVNNTNLILKLDDTPYLVRDCAIKSILARAKINGTALTKVDTSILAKILNYCMNVADGTALFRFSVLSPLEKVLPLVGSNLFLTQSEEKISSVHSAKDSDYSILKLPELFSITNDYLQFSYNGCNFEGSVFSHSQTSALWSISDVSLTKSYEELLTLHGIEYDNILPAVRLTSSDIGVSSATLFPLFLIGDRQLPIILGSPLKLEHKNKASLEDFEENLNLLHSTFQNAINNLSNLITIKIDNPVNCMISIIKKLGLPKKISLEAVEIFKTQIEDNDNVTAYDLYLGINEIIFLMQCAKMSSLQIVNTEEIIARALSFRWKDFDTSINPKW